MNRNIRMSGRTPNGARLRGPRRRALGVAHSPVSAGTVVTSFFGASAPALFAALVLFGFGCSGGQRVVLGDQSPRQYIFGPVVAVPELASPAKTDNPTLTSDLLEIFFTSLRDPSGVSHVWSAKRASRDAPFETPTIIAELVAPLAYETSPAISADGLTLWFASDRAGGLGELDVWVSTRATRSSPWSGPINLAALNSVAKDLPRPLGQHDHVMPMASERASAGRYQMYMAARPPGGAFETPVTLSELATTTLNTADGFLTDDGMTLFFTEGRVSAPADLNVAWRRSPSGSFDARMSLDGLNTTDFEERDPWLSPDGSMLYFTSDRSGVLQIYTSTVSRAGTSP